MAVDDVLNTGKEAQNQLEGFVDKANAGTEAAKQYGQSLLDVATNWIGGAGAVKQWTSALMDTTTFSKTAAAATTMLAASLLGTSKAFAGFDSSTYGAGFQGISSQIQSSIEPLSKMSGGLAMLADRLNIKAPAGIALTAEFMKDAVGAIFKNVDAAQNFQNAYLGMALASGQAAQLFIQAKGDLSGLGSVLSNQVDAITGISSATGIAFPKINDFYLALGKLPGALQETTKATGGSTGSLQAWQAAIDIATAGGMNLKTAADQQTIAYDRFGKVGDKANEFMARQIELSQNSGISLDKTTAYVDRMATAFQYLGDNTKGTSEIFSDMFARLRDSGVGVEPAIALVDGMTTSMTKMSVAQKAFLSARSGGPGGLMGAAQIEKDLKEGKTGEVMDKMRKSLMQQFGGHITTLDEASKSQAAASQFQRQREMLKSGAFGIGGGSTDEQATDLLSALSKPSGGKSGKDAGALLQSLRDQGKTVADQNRTMFTKMGTDVESIKMKGGLELLAAVKVGLGVSNPSVKKMMDADRAEGGTTASIATKATTDVSDISDTMAAKNVQGIKTRAIDVLSNFPDMLAGIKGRVVAPPTAAEKASTQDAERNRIRRQIQSSSASGSVGSAAQTASKSQTVQAAASAASKSGKTTPTAPSQGTSKTATSSGKQPIVVNASIYVDGRLVQKSTSHHMQHEIAGDDSAKQP
jgi:hypothetical protein